MKKRLIYLLLGLVVMVVATCNVLRDEPISVQEVKNSLFDGKWTWVKTDGAGIAGPYSDDSTKAGYSVHYDFSPAALQTWRDQSMDQYYTYTYVVSADSVKQIMRLTDSHGNVTEYLWKRYTVHKDGATSAILVLTNPIPCCDNAFSIYLRRISENITPLN